MRTLFLVACAVLFCGCGKDEYTRANDKLLKQNRERVLREQKAAAKPAPRPPKAPKPAEDDQPQFRPVEKKAPERLPRREPLPATEDAGAPEVESRK